MELKVLFVSLIFYCVCVSCNSSPPLETRVGLSIKASSSEVKVAGLPPDLASAISAESASHILGIYRDTSLADMRDFLDPVKGTYRVEKDTIVFKADDPFVSGNYFARFYVRDMITAPEQVIFGKNLMSVQNYIEYRFVIR